MSGLRKILVGGAVTGEPAAFPEPTLEAIRRALWLAGANRGEVTLMTVLDGPPVDTEALVESSGAAPGSYKAVQALHAVVTAEAEEKGIQVASRIVHGRAWQELIREVLHERYDALLVGTRHRPSVKQLLFGSTALKLLRKCPCPVWVNRPGAFAGETPTVVAADDLGPVGEMVLRYSVEVARLLNARLVLLHALDFPLEGGLIRTESPQEDLDGYRRRVRSEAEKELQERLARTDWRAIQQGVRFELRPGLPEMVIPETLLEYQADLLVMGTLGRAGIPGFLIGNTAERILPELDCSVLAIKPEDFKTPVTVDE